MENNNVTPPGKTTSSSSFGVTAITMGGGFGAVTTAELLKASSNASSWALLWHISAGEAAKASMKVALGGYGQMMSAANDAFTALLAQGLGQIIGGLVTIGVTAGSVGYTRGDMTSATNDIKAGQTSNNAANTLDSSSPEMVTASNGSRMGRTISNSTSAVPPTDRQYNDALKQPGEVSGNTSNWPLADKQRLAADYRTKGGQLEERGTQKMNSVYTRRQAWTQTGSALGGMVGGGGTIANGVFTKNEKEAEALAQLYSQGSSATNTASGGIAGQADQLASLAQTIAQARDQVARENVVQKA